MSYGVAPALQSAVFSRLNGDAELVALVDGAIFDAAPTGGLPSFYVSLGPEDVRDRSDVSGGGSFHDFVVSVVTDGAGFHVAKRAAARVSDLLVGAGLDLSRGTLVSLGFLKARARRVGRGGVRRIDLTFRARVDDGADPQ